MNYICRGIGYDEYVMNNVAENKDVYDEYMQTEEERRMFYVAMTRAKEELYMTYVSGTSGDKEHKCMPSRFILPLMEK